MAAQSNIDIKIIAEFLGKNAFKQADTAASKLNNTVKSLGQSFGLAFGGAALGYAIKSTIKDFADAQREAVNLTNTLKNLGLAFDSAQLNAYVDRIGKLYGVTGDQAVPALQALLSVTGSVSKSTEIFNTALDLAASRSADVSAVAKDLANAYVGNTKGLNQYRLGLTKAELSAMTFEEIMDVIGKQTLGAADEAAKSLSGQLAILSETANQAKERIGGALFNALGGMAGPDGAGGAAKSIENLSIKLTNAITGFSYLVREVKIAQPILVAAGVAIGLAWAPWFTGLSVAALAIAAIGNKLKNNTPQVPTNTGPLFFPGAGDGGFAEREKARKKAEQEAIARNKQLARLVKEQAKAAQAALKAKRLQNAIDKANLALGKSDEIFNIDKIQVAVALANQAEQLGKATSASQAMQIANDTARLNVKRSILALEDAISSKDEAAIIAATKKLNADLGILGALSGQNVKLQDIKSILETLKPVDLVNLGNLDAAIAKMMELLKLQNTKPAAGTVGATATATGTNGAPVYTIPKNTTDFTTGNPDIFNLVNKTVQLTSSSVNDQFYKAMNSIADLPSAVRGANYQARAEQEYAAFLSQINMSGIAGQSLTSGMAQGLPLSGALSGARYAAQAQAAAGGQGYVININTGVGDPNAIAEAIDDVLRQARDRGTLTAL